MIRVAINGFGRIGRLVFRLMEEDSELEVVAVNDLTDAEQLAYLLKYDSNHRNYRVNDISNDSENIIVGGRKVRVYSEKDPQNLPWGELGIDVVFECTGHFTEKDKAMAHINAGAKKVIISAPAKGDLKTIVYNVNNEILDGSEQVISAASCTTNCLAPVLNVLEKEFGIEKGYMTTVHAYTNDQVTLDVSHPKGFASRRGRSAASNIVPASTGAASAIGHVIPSLNGKLQGTAMRVPVSTGSVVDLVLELKRNTTVEEINALLKSKANETLGYTEDPIVSSDIIGSLYGGVVDALLTSVNEVDGKQLIKVVAWYDNEMGYSSQMVRTAKYLMEINK
jgi:glyceraldehyde 3-phosphate dehydrogenase